MPELDFDLRKHVAAEKSGARERGDHHIDSHGVTPLLDTF
jgi:hypothetical protein